MSHDISIKFIKEIFRHLEVNGGGGFTRTPTASERVKLRFESRLKLETEATGIVEIAPGKE
jgi:hypothetical protein